MSERDKLTADAERGELQEQVGETPKKKSMMEDIKEAKQRSANSFAFARMFCGVIFGSIFWTVTLAIFNIIPITMIIVGTVYLDECHVERMIPVGLIVFGCIYLLRYAITNCLRVIMKNDVDNKEEINATRDVDTVRCLNVFLFFIDLFLVVWYILINVWIYRHYSEVQYDNSRGPSYCSRVVYLFSFWLVTIHHVILLACALCCPCIICCCYDRVKP